MCNLMGPFGCAPCFQHLHDLGENGLAWKKFEQSLREQGDRLSPTVRLSKNKSHDNLWRNMIQHRAIWFSAHASDSVFSLASFTARVTTRLRWSLAFNPGQESFSCFGAALMGYDFAFLFVVATSAPFEDGKVFFRITLSFFLLNAVLHAVLL
jgi:hypothetical protein